MLHLCYLVDPNSEEGTNKEKIYYEPNVPNGIPKKTRKGNRKGIITEKMNEKAL